MERTVLVTGANGFIAKNLLVHLEYRYKKPLKILQMTRQTTSVALVDMIKQADFIFHLAGENRPQSEDDFMYGNAQLTKELCALCLEHNPIPILYTSSTQAELANPYGLSKKEAEKILQDYSEKGKVSVYLYRLPNVFGKWSRPNYNSFVATLCHNISRGLPIHINNKDALLNLVYIDDVVKDFIRVFQEENVDDPSVKHNHVTPVYRQRLGDIVDRVYAFNNTKNNLIIQASESGFDTALYATYLSFLPESHFVYSVPEYKDHRGAFYEIFKTEKNGQISVSTTLPGITRGNHFHHSKHEKFVVIKGKARFRFRHLVTDQTFCFEIDDHEKRVVEVPPGYTHNFTNVGDDVLIIFLWANEQFNRENPDTYALEV